jgi:hypothetical protein
VTDANGRPVAGARVYGSNRPAQASLTREDGSYDLTSLVEGENRILAEADGFGTGFFGASLGWGKPVPVRIAEGQAVADIVLPAAVVATGRVVDSAGNPIEGVRVEGTSSPRRPRYARRPAERT